MTIPSQPSTSARSPFPPAWLWLVDEAIPEWVKSTYSPRESWKSKPFSREDAQFFSRGIAELSDLFTDERPKNVPAYFQHPKYRSSYLLYFLPLQAAKFLTLFDLHPGALDAALKQGRKQGVLRVADLGSGPGTASLAFLLKLMAVPLKTGEELPPVELVWLDTNGSVMDDGRALVEKLANSFPRLRGKVTLKTHVAPWWEAPKVLGDAKTSLMILGHVLNEAHGPGRENPRTQRAWQELWGNLLTKNLDGGGCLAVEPASRVPSQLLSKLRDQFFAEALVPQQATSLWGPCLHAGACPMAEGRDWCHFSMPTRIPGEWFREFSEALGSERQWVKFSYLWLASADYPAPERDPALRLVISDPLGGTSSERDLRRSGGKPAAPGPSAVLLCEPGQPRRYPLAAGARRWRGDLVKPSK